METVSGKIINITPEMLTIRAPYQNIERACLRKYSDVLIGLPDGRTITPAQRKKAYVLLTKISEWSGYTPLEVIKEITKLRFLIDHESVDKVFSLSDCDVTTAREYISFLIDLVIENNIPVGQPLAELCEDIGKYIYACLLNKVCAVCGKPAQLHHVDRVGMGRDRHDINHIGMLVLPLCGLHHTECHGMAQEDFNNKYHLVPIKLTAEICKKYHLTNKNLETEKEHGTV